LLNKVLKSLPFSSTLAVGSCGRLGRVAHTMMRLLSGLRAGGSLFGRTTPIPARKSKAMLAGRPSLRADFAYAA
jgi:hypothetical protein